MVFGGDVSTSDGMVKLNRVGAGTYEESLLLKDACIPLQDLPLEVLKV